MQLVKSLLQKVTPVVKRMQCCKKSTLFFHLYGRYVVNIHDRAIYTQVKEAVAHRLFRMHLLWLKCTCKIFLLSNFSLHTKKQLSRRNRCISGIRSDQCELYLVLIVSFVYVVCRRSRCPNSNKDFFKNLNEMFNG